MEEGLQLGGCLEKEVRCDSQLKAHGRAVVAEPC